MTLQEFETNLRRNSVNNGGTYKKADFHIHMPGSSDYEYKEADSMQQLATAINSKEYSFAVVLEHQKFPDIEKVKELQKLCPNTCIIPGAEINVFVNALGKKVGKDYYFHCIVAVNPIQPISDYNYLIEEAKRQFTYSGVGQYPSGFTSNIEDLGKFFISKGALFIPAHLHQSKSPETSRSIDDIFDDDAFLKFVGSNAFTALEVRESGTAKFFNGIEKTKEGIPIPKMICVQSSDAHNHLHLLDRERFTLVQAQTNTFEELQAALSFNHRVQIPPFHLNHSMIIGFHIVGQFLKDEWITLSPSLNCLIGSKGSGKTSILECLRFVLGTSIPKERKESVDKHIGHILGSGGFVDCLVIREDGTKALLTRRADSPNRLRILEEDGTTKNSESIDSIGFNAAILGWHEIEAVADDPLARIGLIDRLGIEKQVKACQLMINRNIQQSREELPSLQSKIFTLEGKLNRRNDLKTKRTTLQKLKKSNLIHLQEQYESFVNCEQKLESLKQRIIKTNRQFERSIESGFSGFIDDFAEASNFNDSIQSLVVDAKNTLGSLNVFKLEVGALFKEKFINHESSINSHISLVKNEFSKFRQNTYDPEVNALPADEREILSKQIQIIEETKELPDIELECAALESDIKSLASSMHRISSEICSSKSSISSLRENIVQTINEDVKTIRVKFQKSVNKNSTKHFTTANPLSDDIVQFVHSFGKEDVYENLSEVFLALSNFSIDDPLSFPKPQISSTKFIDFLSVTDEDDVELSLVLKNNTISPIQNLSAGQRCTTVFPLLLRIKTGPLILDQPEDNLDNRYIADVIAPEFLVKKKMQQFILTSHNANLVVLTDSDSIFHVDSNGSNGTIVKRGFFACSGSEMKTDILSVLDGGEDALRARQKKYGLN